MGNLESLVLGFISPGEVSVTQFLDFLESAPRLFEIELIFTPLTYDARRGRSVSLPSLRSFTVRSKQPPLLFDHLLVPAGAYLTLSLDLERTELEDYFPRTLDNFRDFSTFTKIRVSFSDRSTRIRFAGPNGKVDLSVRVSRLGATDFAFQFLSQFDTSKARRLELVNRTPPREDLPYQALLPMENLRALKISRCKNLSSFFRTLDPDREPSNHLICPKLEKLILCVDKKETFDVQGMINMAATRASRGAKLGFVRITSQPQIAPEVASELGKHILRVEYDSAVNSFYKDDDSDGEGGLVVTAW
jgi:hypothetical protein